MGTYSKVVSEGMKRVCSAFTTIVQPLTFKRGTGRKWTRHIDGFEESIYASRSGDTYGARHSPSISLNIALVSIRVSDKKRATLDRYAAQLLRRHTGYCYHHRFNAETGSTFDRCLDELALFIAEVAEPWFAEQRSAPKRP